MNFSQAPEKILQEFEWRTLILAAVLLMVISFIFQEFQATVSCFWGIAISLVHFQFLKRDGRDIARKAQAGLPYNRILLVFLLKFYSRLLVTGVIVGLLFRYELAQPLYLVLGLSVIVLHLFYLLFEIVFKKSWQVVLRR